MSEWDCGSDERRMRMSWGREGGREGALRSLFDPAAVAAAELILV